MADSKCMLLAGAAAVGVGIAAIGVYYIGYNRGQKVRQRVAKADVLSMKSYRDPNSPLFQYLNAHNIEHPVLSRLRDFTITLPHGRMVTPVEEGILLTILCKAINAKKVIDVGVFTGCSAFAMALGLPRDGKVIACEVNSENAEKGQPYWEEGGVASKIDLRIAPATETLQKLLDNGEDESYDLVFIDADKSNYPEYYRLGMRLLRRGGLVLVDNALFTGSCNAADPSYTDQDTENIRLVNRIMRDDEGLEYVLLSIGSGLGVGLKK